MLLLEDKLSNEIKKFLKTEVKLRIAVAFIGDGASKLFGPKTEDVKIICNLTMGGTNPREIETLIKRFGRENVKQVDNLHAKLYIGAEYAIVGSSNMSANGLGIQPSALREAGYKFKLDQPSGKDGADWFDSLWSKASGISEQDLKIAQDRWKNRDRSRDGDWKSSSRDICDYDFDREDFPLITWYKPAEGHVVGESPESNCSYGGWPTFQEAGENSLDIECENDLHFLSPDRWILTFLRRRNGRLSWEQLSGQYYFDRWKYSNDCEDEENELTSFAIIRYEKKSGPFDITENLSSEFRKLLFESEKYQELLSNTYEGCWFAPRIALMRDFWKELQTLLCKRGRDIDFTVD